jgi:CheY-like chemotaxis protein
VQPGDAKVVLVVDDEFAIVEAVEEILTWEGYTVRTAPNGRVALDLMSKERVDLVLMDMMMPMMGGVETATAMKGDARLRDIPIVAMSAAPAPQDDLWVARLRKPFGFERLIRTLREALAARLGGGDAE